VIASDFTCMLCSPATPTPPFAPLSLHDALPIFAGQLEGVGVDVGVDHDAAAAERRVRLDGEAVDAQVVHAQVEHRAQVVGQPLRSEEHTSELQSRENLVCRLLLEKKKKRQ